MPTPISQQSVILVQNLTSADNRRGTSAQQAKAGSSYSIVGTSLSFATLQNL
jgi:hypothetical protein